MVILALEAHQVDHDNSAHLPMARSILAYMSSVLCQRATGAFSAAEDADTEGQEGLCRFCLGTAPERWPIEGLFYLWSREEVARACSTPLPNAVLTPDDSGSPRSLRFQNALEELILGFPSQSATHFEEVGVTPVQAAELYCAFYHITAHLPFAHPPPGSAHRGDELLEGRIPFTDPINMPTVAAFAQKIAAAHETEQQSGTITPQHTAPDDRNPIVAARPPTLGQLPCLDAARLGTVLAWVRRHLQVVRENRPHPLLDDKVVSSWNGLVCIPVLHLVLTVGVIVHCSLLQSSSGPRRTLICRHRWSLRQFCVGYDDESLDPFLSIPSPALPRRPTPVSGLRRRLREHDLGADRAVRGDLRLAMARQSS